MERSAEIQLENWINSSRRKPLIIRGARQVGKTWLVDYFAERQFDNYVKIDLEKRRDMHIYFGENLEPQNILKHLELEMGRIIPGRTLLFFDEIQACPRAIMALRYFYEQMPELHVIGAGSLLEFAFSDISIPVGRIQYLHLHPMTFYEYLVAIGKKTMADYTLEHPSEVDNLTQQKILSELRSYFFIGGMPECIKVYRNTGSMVETFHVQSEILDSYREDFSKYSPQIDTLCLDTVFLNAARQVGEQIKYTRLNEHHTGPTNRKAFELLTKARIIHKIPSCDPSGLPLGATANPKKFKTAMLDIGLFQRLCQVPVELELKQESLLSMYRGKLAEQFVAQELAAWHSSKIYYWSRSTRGSNAEVDYLVVGKGEIYPVEVKSGKGGSLRSIHLMLEKYPNCPQGLILYNDIYSTIEKQKLTFLPLYCAAIIGDKRPTIV